MKTLNLLRVQEYVNENIVDFHSRRLGSLMNLKLARLLRKNPYLLRAKNVQTASELVEGAMAASLSSSEETLFGEFFEGLAVFVAEETSGGHKSSAEGVDLEFFNKNIHFLVSVKSGTAWGNADQHNKLDQNLREAVRRVKQSRQSLNVQPVLGICYGKTRTVYSHRGYLQVVGQSFWYLISENEDLYTEIIEPIGYKAKEQNELYLTEKANLVNRLVKEFINDYCLPSGAIDWPKLVQLTCGNYGKGDKLPY